MAADLTPPVIPEGSVVITPAMQYAELRALTLAVQDLSSKVDPALSALQKDVDDNAKGIERVRTDFDKDVEKVRTDLEKMQLSISVLQRWQYIGSGVVLLLSALIGWGAINFAKLGG